MKPVLVFAVGVLCFYAGYLTACLMRAAQRKDGEEDKGTIVIMPTSRGRKGYFYREWKKAKEEEGK